MSDTKVRIHNITYIVGNFKYILYFLFYSSLYKYALIGTLNNLKVSFNHI